MSKLLLELPFVIVVPPYPQKIVVVLNQSSRKTVGCVGGQVIGQHSLPFQPFLRPGTIRGALL